MGDMVDEYKQLMTGLGNVQTKRSRIDIEENFVSGGHMFAYNKLIKPPTFDQISNLDTEDIKSFGAVGDGVTDDTAAFVASLASFTCIKITPGNYLITSAVTIPSDAAIVGHGRSSILRYSSDVLFNVSSRATISNVLINYVGANTTTSIGLKVSGDYDYFNNIYFSGRPAFAMDIYLGCEVTVITNSVLAGLISAIRTSGTQLHVKSSTLIANTLCIDINGGTDNSILNSIFMGDNTTTAIDFGSNQEQYSLGNTFDSTISTKYTNKSATTSTAEM